MAPPEPAEGGAQDVQAHQRIHKVRLQPLIGEIDAQLLKRVLCKILKAEDVEKANEALLLSIDHLRALRR